MPILWVFETDVFLFRKACLLYKTSKIVFSRFIFTIYDMGIQGVTRGYKGLQRVTRGDKGLQGVKGVTKGYRRSQRSTETFFNLNVRRYFFLMYCA